MRYIPSIEQETYLKRIGVPEFGGVLPRPVLQPVVLVDPLASAAGAAPASRVPRSRPAVRSRHRHPASRPPVDPFADWLRKLFGGLF